jgi:hypothetical protein
MAAPGSTIPLPASPSALLQPAICTEHYLPVNGYVVVLAV